MTRKGGGEIAVVVYVSTGALLRLLRSRDRSMLWLKPTPRPALPLPAVWRPRPDTRKVGAAWGRMTGTATAAASATTPTIRATEACSDRTWEAGVCGAGVWATGTVVPQRRRIVPSALATRMSHMAAVARKKTTGSVEPRLAATARKTVSSGSPASDGERRVTAR